MSHTIEPATTGRAKCRACGGRIASGETRFGERVPNPFGEDGSETTHWYHVPCAAFTRPEAFLEGLGPTPGAVGDRDRLEAEARLGVEHHRLPRLRAAERAPTGRATCRACRTPIAKDGWRIGLAYYEDGRFSPGGYVHLACARTYVETDRLAARLRHFSPGLSDEDFGEIQAALGGPSAEAAGGTGD